MLEPNPPPKRQVTKLESWTALVLLALANFGV